MNPSTLNHSWARHSVGQLDTLMSDELILSVYTLPQKGRCYLSCSWTAETLRNEMQHVATPTSSKTDRQGTWRTSPKQQSSVSAPEMRHPVTVMFLSAVQLLETHGIAFDRRLARLCRHRSKNRNCKTEQ